jgi:hypothetical protein
MRRRKRLGTDWGNRQETLQATPHPICFPAKSTFCSPTWVLAHIPGGACALFAAPGHGLQGEQASEAGDEYIVGVIPYSFLLLGIIGILLVRTLCTPPTANPTLGWSQLCRNSAKDWIGDGENEGSRSFYVPILQLSVSRHPGRPYLDCLLKNGQGLLLVLQLLLDSGQLLPGPFY